jgi:hypothetical protein
MKFGISLHKFDPTLRIPTEEFDDNGNVIGSISEEEWDRLHKEYEGKIRIGAQVVLDGKYLRLESRIVPPEDEKLAVEELMTMIARALPPL